jgi:ubiquinone/menaquinone biosynthesis C-methylase UbiE
VTAVPGRYLSFDAVADEYDQTRVVPDEIREDVARLCASTARLAAGGLFLDAGVGTGRFGVPLSRHYPGQIVGADISLPMMHHAQEKTTSGGLACVNADLQRLPFGRDMFQGALIVHILHLIERWTLVIDELRRVLIPHTGVLLLGGEQGGRSVAVDFYYERARRLGVLRPSLGAPGLTQTLALLRKPDRGGAHVEPLSAPYLQWQRRVSVEQTLSALARRTYSQMWAVPDDAHHQLLAETEDYARRSFGDLRSVETLDAQFVLYAVRWP